MQEPAACVLQVDHKEISNDEVVIEYSSAMGEDQQCACSTFRLTPCTLQAFSTILDQLQQIENMFHAMLPKIDDTYR